MPLTTEVVGYPPARNAFLFEKSLNSRLAHIISNFSDAKPTLVFCPTRKGAKESVTQLIKDATRNGTQRSAYIRSVEHQQQLLMASRRVENDPGLTEAMKHGLAYHTAGMTRNNRQRPSRASLLSLSLPVHLFRPPCLPNFLFPPSHTLLC